MYRIRATQKTLKKHIKVCTHPIYSSLKPDIQDRIYILFRLKLSAFRECCTFTAALRISVTDLVKFIMWTLDNHTSIETLLRCLSLWILFKTSAWRQNVLKYAKCLAIIRCFPTWKHVYSCGRFFLQPFCFLISVSVL